MDFLLFPVLFFPPFFPSPLPLPLLPELSSPLVPQKKYRFVAVRAGAADDFDLMCGAKHILEWRLIEVAIRSIVEDCADYSGVKLCVEDGWEKKRAERMAFLACGARTHRLSGV